jgi:hypothetical protein
MRADPITSPIIHPLSRITPRRRRTFPRALPRVLSPASRTNPRPIPKTHLFHSQIPKHAPKSPSALTSRADLVRVPAHTLFDSPLAASSPTMSRKTVIMCPENATFYRFAPFPPILFFAIMALFCNLLYEYRCIQCPPNPLRS